MAQKSAIYKDYLVTVEENGSITVSRAYNNVTASLREMAATIGFVPEPQWNTRTFASKLIQHQGGTVRAEVGEYTVVQRASGKVYTYRTYANRIRNCSASQKVYVRRQKAEASARHDRRIASLRADIARL